MSAQYSSITLKKGKDQSLGRFHRWVFSGAIEQDRAFPGDGDIVEIFDHNGRYLATGHYQDANIAVRILSFTQETINHEYWLNKLRQAYHLRGILGLTDNNDTNGYRLVFGEGDELPGLVIDFYKGAAIIQTHSTGMNKACHSVAEALNEIYEKKLHTIYHIRAISKSDRAGEFLFGSAGGTWFLENGLDFYAGWEGGQKTGYFLDQRNNRKLLRKYVADRTVLDAFCYSGGFTANALAGKAKKVVAVDISSTAIDAVTRNLHKNRYENFETHTTDVLEFLKSTNEKFDAMVIDPPAFAKHKSARHAAIQAYKRLNLHALKKLNSNGILFTFSCSQVVDRILFENTIRAAAIEAGRKTRILHRLSQPADHPVNIYHPESEYLTGLVLWID